jgi:hypothetical protein
VIVSVTAVLRDRVGSTLDTVDGAQLNQRAFDAFGICRIGALQPPRITLVF